MRQQFVMGALILGGFLAVLLAGTTWTFFLTRPGSPPSPSVDFACVSD